MKHERLLKVVGTVLVVVAGAVIMWRTSEEVGTGRAADRVRALAVESVRGGSGLEMVGNPGAEAGVFKASERVSADRESAAASKGDLPDSLQEVFIGARHAFQAVTEEERKLPENEGALYFASNPKNQGQVRFLEDGAVRFSAKGETCAVWQGRRMNEVELERLGGPSVTAAEAEFQWSGGISETFVNVPEGLRHQIRLRERTEPADGGNLRLGFPLKNSIAQEDPAGAGILIRSRSSSDVALHYGVPQVTDSTGRALRASVSARGSQGFSIEVEDRAAVYPLNLGTLAVWKIRDAGLVDPDGRTQRPDSFGWSVALSGDIAVIGAPGDNTPFGESAGSVYVFRQSRNDRWALMKQLRSPQGASRDAFGVGVAMSGDRLAVRVGGAGWIWIFTRSGRDWVPDQRITSPFVNGAFFGVEMDLFEDRMIVSVPSSSSWHGSSFGYGNAYVYVRTPEGWQVEANLIDLLEGRSDFGTYGDGLALSGDLAVVAGSDSSLEDGVFVFRRIAEGWKFEAFLPRPDYEGSSNFGNAIAIEGNQILVGDPEALRQSDRLRTGAVYVYEFNDGQWALKQEICPEYLREYEQYGIGIVVSGTRAIIRARAVDPSFQKTQLGRDFLFEQEGGLWVRTATLSQPDSEPGALFGHGIAISGDTVLLAGGKTEVPDGKWQTVEDVDMVSVIRLTQEISVQGSGDVPIFSGQRENVVFGSAWKVGDRATRTFVVKNTGMLPLEGLKTRIKPGGSADYFVSKQSPVRLGPGESANLIIGLAPKSAGRHRATVQIFSNDEDEKPFEFEVKTRAVEK